MDEKRITLPVWESLPDIGLYMDQVITFLDRVFAKDLPKGEITKAMVNNYVKSKLIPRPMGKKYDQSHIARLLMICVLKQSLNMESIRQILTMLCRASVQEGYEIFCRMMETYAEAVRTGHIEMNWEEETPEERALHAGIMASLCTIYTYQLLANLQAEN